jgi:hypothetical protein
LSPHPDHKRGRFLDVASRASLDDLLSNIYYEEQAK